MTIQVESPPLQTFEGFGLHDGCTYLERYRDTVNSFFVKPLRATHARFYIAGPHVDSIKAAFLSRFGYSDGTTFFHDYLKQDPDLYFLIAGGEQMTSLAALEPFCTKWAEAVKWLKEDQGLDIRWTTLTNEPNDYGFEWQGQDPTKRKCAPEFYAPFAKTMRSVLDSYGLTDVKIFAPEVSSVDSMCHVYINLLKDDPEAWPIVEGLFTKAYNMCADWTMKELCEESGKPYFTAAGSNLIDWHNYRDHGIGKDDVEQEYFNDNDHWGADMCGRVFNDFNHMVTHWGWYLTAHRPDGFPYSDPRFNPHRLAYYVDTSMIAGTDLLGELSSLGYNTSQWFDLGDGTAYMMITLKYYYLKQLAHMFDVGCVFRYCESDPALPHADMWYTYGQKPAVSASAARNPDGSFTIGVVNLTGCTSDGFPVAGWHATPYFEYYDAERYDVTIRMHELIDSGPRRFAMYRSSRTERFEFVDSVTMTGGEMTISVDPKALVTLRGSGGSAVVAASASRFQRGSLGDVRAHKGMIDIAFANAGSYSIKLAGLSGRIVYTHRKFCCSAPAQYRIPALVPGCYVLRVSGRYRSMARRIVVQ
ncbi:MAG: hypothetical protein GF418_13390 [Chitinivibrionales bacterium]|nr:hypothetical protein [Chitinivibrionales bacterium]MBD3396613.1 hypothetical protein [Chitinivibrionales bacterium]